MPATIFYRSPGRYAIHYAGMIAYTHSLQQARLFCWNNGFKAVYSVNP